MSSSRSDDVTHVFVCSYVHMFVHFFLNNATAFPMMLKTYFRKFLMMVMTYLKKFPMVLKTYLRKFLMMVMTYLKKFLMMLKTYLIKLPEHKEGLFGLFFVRFLSGFFFGI